MNKNFETAIEHYLHNIIKSKTVIIGLGMFILGIFMAKINDFGFGEIIDAAVVPVLTITMMPGLVLTFVGIVVVIDRTYKERNQKYY